MKKEQYFIKLKDFLDDHIDGDTDTTRVTVFPLRCGAGKSTYIKHLISRVLQQEPNRGLIIVTDSLERMHEFTKDNSDDELAEYFERIQNRIAVLENKTLSEQLKSQVYKPILVMSTQRFFALTREEIRAFTKFNDGVRDRIIIDEKPYITEQRHWTIKTLDEIDIIFRTELDNTINQCDKSWMILQWEALRQKMINVINTFESQNESYQYNTLYDNESHTVTEDDDRFYFLLKKYRAEINRRNSEAYKDILAICQTLRDGALFTSVKKAHKNSASGDQNNEYKNFFTVVRDNSDKLIDVGAKIFVFDATAGLSQEYRLDYIDLIDCNEFNVPLNHLTIDIVDMPSGKTRLCSASDESQRITDCVINYLNSLPYKVETIFTHKKIEDRFVQGLNPEEKNGGVDVEHFGNIRGRNDFRDKSNIAQIGLNRFPNIYYMLLVSFMKLFSSSDDKPITRMISQGLIRRTMLYEILADFEQNMFRSQLRKIDCEDPIRYIVFFDTKNYADFVDMIKERYEPLGATINVLPRPLEYSVEKTRGRKTVEKTNAQKVFDWLCTKPSMTEFKIKELLQDTGLSKKQLDKIRENNISIATVFDQMKTNRRGYYRTK